jgi:hypothetical protein
MYKIFRLIVNFLIYNYKIFLASKNRDLLKKNIDLKNKYKGRVFILATGTSISEYDLNPLVDEYTIGVNRFFLHPDYQKLNIDFFTLIEDWSYQKLTGLSWIAEMCFLKSKRSMITFLNSMGSVYINDDKDYEYRDKNNFFDKDNIYYVQNDGSFSSDADIKGELDAPCNILNGSLYFSVGLAMYLGFKEIYLLGVDNTKKPLTVGHFYDGLREDWDKTKLNQNLDSDLHGIMVNKQKSIKKYSESKGVDIYNISSSGYKSHIFKEVELNSLFK